MAVDVRTLSGEAISLAGTDLNSFAATLRGSVHGPEDAAYTESRTLWNAMIDRRPGFVVRCVGAGDVQACINFARERHLALCIKGGGHNIAGLAVQDGAMMLDLSRMRGVWVDRERRIARAQAGCTLGDVDRETQLHGLAAVLGFVSNTGIAGLTLGGGFGYLTRRFGWTSDNVRAFEVVTADGELRSASDEENADLFWGLRGGGGNFGVVTAIEYDLYPIGPDILGGAIAWQVDDAPAVLELFRELHESSPPEHVCVAAIRPAPPAPWLPKEVHGKLIVALFVCDTGPIDAATKRVERIKSFGSPVGDVVQIRPYTTQQSLIDATQPNGRRYYWKSEYTSGVEPGLLDAMIRHGRQIPSPHSAILLFPLHGAIREFPDDHSAVGCRDTSTVFNIAGSWENASDDDRNVTWARDAWADMRPFSTGGTYVNFLTEDEGEERLHDAYGGNYARLMELKRRYDPENHFRANKNIRPSARG